MAKKEQMTKLAKPVPTAEFATDFRLVQLVLNYFAAPTENDPDKRELVLGAVAELFNANGQRLQRKTFIFNADDPIWDNLSNATLAVEDNIIAAIKSQLEAE